ncbi:MAG: FecR family protein [Ignavibacteriales bacterium]|nr:FecR family protein [Ignavibacteriales bacterium]
MKAKSLIIIFIIPFLLGFNSGKKSTPSSDTPVALVKKIVIDVTYKKGGQSDWDAAKTGLPLNDGDQVKTGPKSLALIIFTDGSGLLRVRENAILNVYGKSENKKLNKNTVLNKGTIGFEVNKQEDEEFKFTTPTAVASIRGTDGSLEVDDNNSTIIRLDKGKLDFQSLKGDKKEGSLTEGNTARIDNSGNISINPQTQADKDKNSSIKNTNTKKVKIKTKLGDVEIEYYSSENK